MPDLHEASEAFNNVWKDSGGGEISDRLNTLISLGRTLSSAVDPARAEFLSICFGERPRSLLSRTLSFKHRFFKEAHWQKPKVGPVACSKISLAFDFGFLTHIFFTSFPSRENVSIVDADMFRQQWVPRSLKAGIELHGYSRRFNDFPEILFRTWYNSDIRQIAKDQWNVGILRRATVESYFHSTYLGGISLALSYDLATSNNIE